MKPSSVSCRFFTATRGSNCSSTRSMLDCTGTPEGIANLKNVALNWAIRKNSPPPDGWISLNQVRTILRAAPAAPLPKDFFVPLGCEVPDETLHRDFVRDTAAGAEQAFVLTGPEEHVLERAVRQAYLDTQEALPYLRT